MQSNRRDFVKSSAALAALEVIEQQDGARPYHDWNERITVECYAANTASRILDQP